MRVSIGHRLFVSVLLALLTVTATGIVLMRQNVMSSFAEYAVNIELDRLDELSSAIASQHTARKGWDFIRTERGTWIAHELARLQQQRQDIAPPAPPQAPVPPGPPAPPVQPAPPLPPAASPAADEVMPPLPPAAPAAEKVVPPLPPPRVPPAPLPPPPIEPGVDSLELQDRVTLLDADDRYLAGHRPGDEAGARRAINVNGEIIGYLVVARTARPSDAMASAFLQRLKDSMLIIVVASFALSGIAAVLLAAHFRKPIQRLADGARALADGRYETRLATTRSDELGELAHSFNLLAHKLDYAESSRRRWVADTSHELRTPLAVLRAQLEAVQDGVRPASADTMVAMLRQVLSLNKLIDELYVLARADIGALDYERQRVDLWQLAREQADAFGEKCAAAGLAIETGTAPADTTVMADPERMRQVFANLFENCIRYCGAGSRIRLEASRAAGSLALTLDDSGPGVPDQALGRLSERFYRVEDSRSREHGGAGLGLALCHRITEAHGGQLGFTRSPLGGLRVQLTLPEAAP